MRKTFLKLVLPAVALIVVLTYSLMGASTSSGQDAVTTAGTFAPAQLVADRMVNNSATDQGEATTQSQAVIAVRPSDGRLCAGWTDSQHKAYSPGNTYVGFGYSADGGTTWVDAGALLPIPGHINRNQADVGFRAVDGKFYFVTLDSQGIAVHVSSDGCQSFEQHLQAHVGTSDDKELMAIDNWSGSPFYGRMYIAYTDAYGATPGGVIKLIRSSDGVTWSQPVNVHLQDGRQAQAAFPAVAPNGNVYVAWLRWETGIYGPIDIEMARSTDGGLTFNPVSSPLVGGVNPWDDAASARCERPALNGFVRIFPAPQIGVDQGGVLHVVYMKDPDVINVGDTSNIYYRRSTDGGTTWGPEVRINDDAGTRDQFLPTLSVAKSGPVAIYWYDRRNDPNNLAFQVYEALSWNGGITWEANEPLSDVSSPVPPLAPNFDPILVDCFMGDYNKADSDSSNFYMIWSDSRNIHNEVDPNPDRPDPDVFFDKDPDQPPLCPEVETCVDQGCPGPRPGNTCNTLDMGVRSCMLSGGSFFNCDQNMTVHQKTCRCGSKPGPSGCFSTWDFEPIFCQ